MDIRYSVLVVLFAFLVVAGAVILVYDVSTPHSVVKDEEVHPIVLEVLAPVAKEKGQDIMPTLVPFKLTINFGDAANRNKANGDIRQLRRQYTKAIGVFLSNRITTDNIKLEIQEENLERDLRNLVASTSEKIFGIGTLNSFDIEANWEGN